MTEADWNYTRAKLDEAQRTDNVERLYVLAKHQSKFVRAQVAGNRHTTRALREYLSLDSSRGVVNWLIGNPSLTKEEFNDIFSSAQNAGYCSVVTQALAHSKLADTQQLLLLSHETAWSVQIAILNNYHGRANDYRTIIKKYLAKPDTNPRNWDEIEKLAYYRTYGSRLPTGDESE